MSGGRSVSVGTEVTDEVSPGSEGSPAQKTQVGGRGWRRLAPCGQHVSPERLKHVVSPGRAPALSWLASPGWSVQASDCHVQRLMSRLLRDSLRQSLNRFFCSPSRVCLLVA